MPQKTRFQPRPYGGRDGRTLRTRFSGRDKYFYGVSKGFLVNSIRLRLDYVARKALAAPNNEAKGLGKFSVVSCQKPITRSVQLPYLVWATVFSHIFSTIFEHFFSRKWKHCFICVRMYDNYKKKKQMLK